MTIMARERVGEDIVRHILGVDGGNSKTLAVVADETGTVLGIGRTGGSNYQGVGVPAAMREIRGAAHAAVVMAGTDAEDIAVASYTLAGADLPEDFATLQPALATLGLGARLALDNDSIAALRSGSDRPNAVIVGWGAGTNGAGRNAAGETVRLAALGWISGDWGGGDDLAREAIRLVARAHDLRGRRTALEALVLSELGVPDADEMTRRLYFRQVGRDQLTRIPPLVFRAADEGDPVAVELVEAAGNEVAATAVALLRRLDIQNREADVVLGGSVFRTRSALFFETIETGLRAQAPLARVVIPDVEPVIGAMLLGLDLVGTADSTARRRARESYDRLAGRHSAVAGPRRGAPAAGEQR